MKQAVITGASKGLGKMFAHQLASRGFNLLLIARSERILSDEVDIISAKYGVTASYLTIDLSETNSTSTVISWCTQHHFQPSVLINNAGYACWGFFDQIELI